MTDPYQVLGVSPSATDEQIKNAYRELARKYHPDNYANNPLADLAQEKMKEINEAYDQIQRQRKQQQSSRSGQGYSQGGYSQSGYSQSGYSQSGYSRSYAGQGGSSRGGSQFADIRQLLNANRVSDAEELLEGYEAALGCIARDRRLESALDTITQNAQALASVPGAAPQAGAILRAVREIKE